VTTVKWTESNQKKENFVKNAVSRVSPDSLTRIRFSPYAWALLNALCQEAETEIGCYGISDTNDPLYIVNLYVPKQQCTCVNNDFDMNDVAEFAEKMAENDISPAGWQRMWIHTHPVGMTAHPSLLDEETFSQPASISSSWSAMVILSKNGDWYGRLRVKGHITLEAEVILALQSELNAEEPNKAKITELAKTLIAEKVTVIKCNAKVIYTQDLTVENTYPIEWDNYVDYDSYKGKAQYYGDSTEWKSPRTQQLLPETEVYTYAYTDAEIIKILAETEQEMRVDGASEPEIQEMLLEIENEMILGVYKEKSYTNYDEYISTQYGRDNIFSAD